MIVKSFNYEWLFLNVHFWFNNSITVPHDQGPNQVYIWTRASRPKGEANGSIELLLTFEPRIYYIDGLVFELNGFYERQEITGVTFSQRLEVHDRILGFIP